MRIDTYVEFDMGPRRAVQRQEPVRETPLAPVWGSLGPLADITGVSSPGFSPPNVVFQVTVTVKNAGDVGEVIWCQISNGTGVVGPRQQLPALPGNSTNFIFNLTMPNNAWNLTAEAAVGLANPVQDAFSFGVRSFDATKGFDIKLEIPSYAQALIVPPIEAPATSPANQPVLIGVNVKNIGMGNGKMWCRVVDANGLVAPQQKTPIDIGVQETVLFSFSTTMPDHDWSLTAEAGHNADFDSSMAFSIGLVTGQAYSSIESVAAPKFAKAGDAISVSVVIKNTGDVSGMCSVKITDRDTNSVVGEEKSADLAVGETAKIDWTLVMPNNEWKLKAEAGNIMLFDIKIFDYVPYVIFGALAAGAVAVGLIVTRKKKERTRRSKVRKR